MTHDESTAGGTGGRTAPPPRQPAASPTWRPFFSTHPSDPEGAGAARADAQPWILAAAVAMLSGTLAGPLGAWLPAGTVLGWLCDLTTHFRAYHVVVVVAGLAVAVWRGGRAARVIFAAATLLTVMEMAPAWRPVSARHPLLAHEPAAVPVGDAGTLSIVSLNVQFDNRDTARAMAYLRACAADLVVLLEVDATWAHALTDLDTVYPFAHVEPGRSFEGLAMLSRWPMRESAVVEFGTQGMPSIVATITTPGGDIDVIATHPRPPLTPALDGELRDHLRAVGRRAAAGPRPCLVVGDLNATPWSAAFRGLVEAGGLHDSALGRGIQPTWNARLWAPRIPIDHILVSPDVTVLDRRVGPAVGSDHFPVEARLRLPAPQRVGASSARSMPSRLSFL